MEENSEVITHARVKTITGKVLVIKVTQIVEFSTKPPKNKHDFDCKQIYNALITDHSDDESDAAQVSEVGVQIGDLASTVEEVASWVCKRGNFPPLDHSVIIEFKNKKHTRRILKRKVNDEETSQQSESSSDEDDKINLNCKRRKKKVKTNNDVEKKAQLAILDKKLKAFAAKDDLVLPHGKDSVKYKSQERSSKPKNTDLSQTKFDHSQHFFNIDTLDNINDHKSEPKIVLPHAKDDKNSKSQETSPSKEDTVLSPTKLNLSDDLLNSDSENSDNKKNSTAKSDTNSSKNGKDDNTEIGTADIRNEQRKTKTTFDDPEKIKREYEILQKKIKLLQEDYNKAKEEVTVLKSRKPLEPKPGTSKDLDTVSYIDEEINCAAGLKTSTPKSDSESGYYSVISSKCKKRLYFEKINTKTDDPEKKLNLISKVEKVSDFKKEFQYENKDGIKVHVISLGNNILITFKSWEKALKMKTCSRFSKEILRSMYSRKDLSVRSVAGDPNCKTPRGTHVRQQITPKKHAALKRCLSYYIIKRKKFLKGSDEYDEELDKLNHYIGEEINCVIQTIKKDMAGTKKQDQNNEGGTPNKNKSKAALTTDSQEPGDSSGSEY